MCPDLGTLGGEPNGAHAINASGVVVGFGSTVDGRYHAVILTNGALVDLGTLGGSNSLANAINQSGMVVGFSNPTGSGAQRAFEYVNGGMIDLGVFLPGSTNSLANDINSAGAIVGEYHTSDGHQRPFILTNGVAFDLGFDGVANSINDSGTIVGFERTNGNVGFILSGGQIQYVGTLGGNDTSLGRINKNGLAVGNSMNDHGAYHAFTFFKNTLLDLGTLGGTSSGAYAVNNLGQVAGQAKDSSGVWRAYVYKNGTMLDLNNFLPVGSAWFLTIAYGINDLGQIVGEGQIAGKTHGFLLTPTPFKSPSTPV